MKKIILNEDLLHDLYAEDGYMEASNKDYLKNNGRNGSRLNLEVRFTIDVLKTKFRSLLKRIEDEKDAIVVLNFKLIYVFNTEDGSFKLEKDDTNYYIKGDYILKNEELLSEIKDRLVETHEDVKNRIGNNKLFKIIDVDTEDSKSYEEKLSEIIEVEKEAIKLCEKVKVGEYSIDLESYINQYYADVEDDEYDEDEYGIISGYDDIIYDDIKSIIDEAKKLSDSTNSTEVEEYWENDDKVSFRILERNHLYYYDLYNGENYEAEDVFDLINNNMLGNFTGLELLSKVEPQNNFTNDDVLNSIDLRYEEVVLNKEDYLEEVKSMVDGIVKAINETYSKLEDLTYNNGF